MDQWGWREGRGVTGRGVNPRSDIPITMNSTSARARASASASTSASAFTSVVA